MAGLDLTVAGTHFLYGVETVAGTKPSTFIDIPDPMEIPAINASPQMIKTTSLNETTYETYVQGLIDIGSSLGIKFALNDTFKTTWATLYTAYETAKASNLAIWFQVFIPGMTDGFFFTGQPAELGLDALSVGNHLQDTAYVTPNRVKGWSAKVAAQAAQQGGSGSGSGSGE